MRYWYFFFEGRFRESQTNPHKKGVFSTCLVPNSNFEQAESLLLAGLDFHGIDLVEVKEFFDVDPDELDSSHPANTKWLEWCEEARKEGTVIFDPWHVFNIKSS